MAAIVDPNNPTSNAGPATPSSAKPHSAAKLTPRRADKLRRARRFPSNPLASNADQPPKGCNGSPGKWVGREDRIVEDQCLGLGA
jgi:hypothetical protein